MWLRYVYNNASVLWPCSCNWSYWKHPQPCTQLVATILFYFSTEMEHKNQILFLEVTYKFKISVYRKDILSVNFVIIHIIIIKSSLKNFSYWSMQTKFRYRIWTCNHLISSQQFQHSYIPIPSITDSQFFLLISFPESSILLFDSLIVWCHFSALCDQVD